MFVSQDKTERKTVNNGTHSSVTRDLSCNQMKQTAFICGLESDTNMISLSSFTLMFLNVDSK